MGTRQMVYEQRHRARDDDNDVYISIYIHREIELDSCTDL